MKGEKAIRPSYFLRWWQSKGRRLAQAFLPGGNAHIEDPLDACFEAAKEGWNAHLAHAAKVLEGEAVEYARRASLYEAQFGSMHNKCIELNDKAAALRAAAEKVREG